MDEAPTHARDHDLGLILRIQGLRAFLYGFGSVLLGTVLAEQGLSGAEVGGVFTAMLAGMAIASAVIAVVGDRLGRRRAYAVLFVVMGAAGSVFAFTHWLPALVIASLTGTISTDPNESGPITSLEQAMIGEAPSATRVRVFGRYNAIAYLAGSVGALAAGGPQAFRSVFPALPANQRWLLAFPVVALACLWLTGRLSAAVEGASGSQRGGSERKKLRFESEGAERPPRRHRRPPLRSRRTIRRLAALFAVDSFGGGFIVQSFLVFWFHRKYGASVELMGLVFFGAGLLQAASSIVAARLAGWLGLLNVMVFTHLPSNVLLIAVPFAPNLTTAVVLLLCRFALSQMDVPTRQGYLAAVVDPEERTAAAAYTNTARYATRPAGPVVGGALMQRVALAAPFVAAGGLKIAYDLALYALFRRIPLPAEGVASGEMPSERSPSERRPLEASPSERSSSEAPASPQAEPPEPPLPPRTRSPERPPRPGPA
jgi:predicted MFS family arabinose efflux permease